MSMRVQGVVDIYRKRICMGHKIENIGLRRIMWSLVTQVGNIVLLKQSLEFCWQICIKKNNSSNHVKSLF